MAEQGRGRSMPLSTTSRPLKTKTILSLLPQCFPLNLKSTSSILSFKDAVKFLNFEVKKLPPYLIKSLKKVKLLLQYMWFPLSPDTVNQKWSAVVRDYPRNQSMNLSHVQLPDP